MSLRSDDFLKAEDWLVWILAPFLKTNDPNLQYYYDFSQSIQEYQNVFSELNLAWKWQSVEIQNFKSIIAAIKLESYPKTPIVINLCDGDEANGVPGISVIDALEYYQLIYTGADRYFYDITTSKIPMKELFDKANVPNSPWMVLDPDTYNSNALFKNLKQPLIVKPAISAGSLGLGLQSVVKTELELSNYLKVLQSGYKGWDLSSGGLFVEEFIEGQEYTTLIVGPSQNYNECKIYTPVERVFENSIPSTEQFLSFDRLWEIYENESPLSDDKPLWNYEKPPDHLIDEIKNISWQAYKAMRGTGYGRIDLRRNEKTGKILVLEVNAQCGLSKDENFTSIGAILRISGSHFKDLIIEILIDAFIRHQSKIKL